VVIEAVPLSRTSEAAGLTTVIRTAFIGVGSQIMVMSLSISTVSARGGEAIYPSDFAYTFTFGCIAGTMAAVALLTLLLSSKPRQDAFDAVRA
jgi:hypothetical protein